MLAVYIIRSVTKPRRIYKGITSNLEARLTCHNEGLVPITASHRPWNLVIAVYFADSGAAHSFERYLKSGSGITFARRHFLGQPKDPPA